MLTLPDTLKASGFIILHHNNAAEEILRQIVTVQQLTKLPIQDTWLLIKSLLLLLLFKSRLMNGKLTATELPATDVQYSLSVTLNVYLF